MQRSGYEQPLQSASIAAPATVERRTAAKPPTEPTKPTREERAPELAVVLAALFAVVTEVTLLEREVGFAGLITELNPAVMLPAVVVGLFILVRICQK
jgi:hypothetical protein